MGLPKAINLNVADWSHVQELDYEQLAFQCRFCHGYGHFARTCKKKIEEEVDKKKEINGPKFKTQTQQSKEIKSLDKE